MPYSTTHLLFFAANLTFIVTHLYGWLLKWYYKPEAYREHFHELFPAQRAVGLIYLLQVFELTYLIQIDNPDALLFANAFALLFFAIQMVVMCELYFFPERQHPFLDYWFVLPSIIALAPLFLQAVSLVRFSQTWRVAIGIVVILVFAVYFWKNLRMAMKIGRAVQQANENCYADSDDFPVRFANIIKWVPTLILMLLAINFLANEPWVKFGRDLIFSCASVWFCVLTLNPWRKVRIIPEYTGYTDYTESADSSEDAGSSESTEASRHLSDKRCEELASRLKDLMEEKRIYTAMHITSEVFIHRLRTNPNYLLEAIKRNGYISFYDMINQHRVRHAISLITQHPDWRMNEIAAQCGFTSQASMAKAFASQGKSSPRTYRRQ